MGVEVVIFHVYEYILLINLQYLINLFTPLVFTEHDKILEELEQHDKVTSQKLTNIEHVLQKLLGKSNASKPKVKNIDYDNSVRTACTL